MSEFFQSSAIQLQTLSESRLTLARSGAVQSDPLGWQSLDQLTRHVRLFGKYFRRLQQLGSTKFISLPLCNDLVLYYWGKVVQAAGMSDHIAGKIMAVFTLQMLMLRQIHGKPFFPCDFSCKQCRFSKEALQSGPLSVAMAPLMSMACLPSEIEVSPNADPP